MPADRGQQPVATHRGTPSQSRDPVGYHDARTGWIGLDRALACAHVSIVERGVTWLIANHCGNTGAIGAWKAMASLIWWRVGEMSGRRPISQYSGSSSFM